MEKEQKTPAGLRQKLFAIQKSLRTFQATEPSEKKNASGVSDYTYTPDWKIVETLREEMDKHGLMLDMNVESEEHEVIDYPVYKLVNGNPTALNKKEVLSTVNVAFQFVDVTTGEEGKTYHMIASGANGTDKSLSSALSTAERYFLLKFFHITTRDKNDEADAHDSQEIRGLESLQNASAAQVARQQSKPAAKPAAPAPAPTVAPAAAPAYRSSVKVTSYEDAVARLACFNQGTPSHAQCMQELMTGLKMLGYNTAEPGFAQNLANSAQEIRTRGVA